MIVSTIVLNDYDFEEKHWREFWTALARPSPQMDILIASHLPTLVRRVSDSQDARVGGDTHEQFPIICKAVTCRPIS
jgi:hypothetical protein